MGNLGTGWVMDAVTVLCFIFFKEDDQCDNIVV